MIKLHFSEHPTLSLSDNSIFKNGAHLIGRVFKRIAPNKAWINFNGVKLLAVSEKNIEEEALYQVKKEPGALVLERVKPKVNPLNMTAKVQLSPLIRDSNFVSIIINQFRLKKDPQTIEWLNRTFEVLKNENGKEGMTLIQKKEMMLATLLLRNGYYLPFKEIAPFFEKSGINLKRVSVFFEDMSQKKDNSFSEKSETYRVRLLNEQEVTDDFPSNNNENTDVQHLYDKILLSLKSSNLHYFSIPLQKGVGELLSFAIEERKLKVIKFFLESELGLYKFLYCALEREKKMLITLPETVDCKKFLTGFEPIICNIPEFAECKLIYKIDNDHDIFLFQNDFVYDALWGDSYA